MKKKILFVVVSCLLFAHGLSVLPKVSAASSDPYLNCLCEAACSKAGWNCSEVGCAYDPNPVDASPECANPGNGACICEGYGCGRAAIDYTSAASLQCKADTTSTDCKSFYDNYNQVRGEYLKDAGMNQGFTDYGYKVTNMYNTNVGKLTTAFVLSRLSPPAMTGKDFLIDRIQDQIFDKVFSALQSAQTKADIQVNLLKMLKLTNAAVTRIDNVQPVRINKMKDLLAKMKVNNCSTKSTVIDLLLPALRNTASPVLKDILPETPRDVSITYLQQNKIVKGYDDGTFKENNPINRAEFTKILMESTYPGETFSETGCFPDAPAGAWYSGYVCAAKKKGIIAGYPNNTFQPSNTINASEMLKIMLTALKADAVAPLKTGQAWYQPYWDAAVNLGILPNDVKTPGDSITRGQMSETIFSVIAQPLEDKNIWTTDYSIPESQMVDINTITVDPSVPTSFTWDFIKGATSTPTPTLPVPLTPAPTTTPTPTITPPVAPPQAGSTNNTIATAQKLTLSVTPQTVHGTILKSGDLNYYTFTLGSTSQMNMSLDVTNVKNALIPTNTAYYDARLLDSSGNELNCNMTAGSFRLVHEKNDCVEPAGTYYMKVMGDSENEFSSTPYGLTLSATTAP